MSKFSRHLHNERRQQRPRAKIASIKLSQAHAPVVALASALVAVAAAVYLISVLTL